MGTVSSAEGVVYVHITIGGQGLGKCFLFFRCAILAFFLRIKSCIFQNQYLAGEKVGHHSGYRWANYIGRHFDLIVN